MPELSELSQDQRLRNHFNIDKRRRTSRHSQPDPHYHSYYEVYYLIDGACRFFVLDTMYTLSGGDLLICAPGEYHRNSYFGPKLHDRFTVYFDTQRIPAELNPYIGFLPSVPGDQRFYHIPEEYQAEFIGMLHYMLEMYQKNTPMGELALRYQFPSWLIFVSERAVPIHGNTLAANQTDQSLQKAAQFIAAHYTEPLTLEQVSGMAGFSPAYFSRKFKDFAGLSFSNYLMHIRLREAAALLRSTTLSVADLSQRCGFSSANYFGDVFRMAYGVSPRDYRKQEEEFIPSAKDDRQSGGIKETDSSPLS